MVYVKTEFSWFLFSPPAEKSVSLTPSPDTNVFHLKLVLNGDEINQSLTSSRFDLVFVFFSVFHCHFDPQSSIKVFILCFDLKTENSKQKA